MADFGEVKVSLGLDTSKAKQQLADFFSAVGQQKVSDPLKGLDKSFDDVAEKAKKLGFEWDAVSKKFKSSKGDTASVEQMRAAITDTAKAAKNSGTSFEKMAASIKESGAQSKVLSAGLSGVEGDLSGIAGASRTAGAGLDALGSDAREAGAGIQGMSGHVDGLEGNLRGFDGIVDTAAQGVKSFGSLAKGAGNDLKTIQLGSVGQAIKAVSQDSKSAGTSLQGLGQAGKIAGQELKGIGSSGASGLKAIATAAKGADGSLDMAAAGAKGLSNALKTTGSNGRVLTPLQAALAGISRDSGAAKIGVSGMGQAFGQAARSAQPLSAVPAKFKQIAPSFAPAIRASLDLGKSFQGTAKEAGILSKGIQQSFQAVLQGIPQGIGMAIGNTLLAPLKMLAQAIPAAVEEFRKLDESLRLTLEISGAGAAKFDTLQASILRVASASAATTQEVADVAQSFARAGLSLDEIDAALEGVIKGAEATGTAYGEMADIGVSAMGAFGLAAEDMSDIMDTLTVAANSSNQTVTDLGEALKYVGPVAKSVGSSLQETSLALEVLANSGIRGSQAGTSLRTILTNLQIAASGAGEEFKELTRGAGLLEKAIAVIGGNMRDANGDLLAGKDLIIELQRSMAGLSAGEKSLVAKRLAGSEGLPALNALISATGDQLDDLANSLDNRAGAAAEQANNALKGLAGSFKLLQSNVSAALVQIGGVVATLLKPFIDTLTAVLSTLNQLPGPIKAAATALGVLGAALGATVVTMNALKQTAAATFAANLVSQIQNFVKAFTAANLQTTLANITNGIKAFGAVARTEIILGLSKATTVLKGFTAALKAQNIASSLDSLTKGLGTVVKGLKGIPAAGKATQLSLDLFGGAAKGAGAAAGGLAKGAAQLAPAMGAAAGAAAPAAAATTAAGGAAAAATPAVGSLAAAFGSFLVAIAPIALAVGALVGVYAYLKDRSDKAREATDSLTDSQDILAKALDDVGEKAADQENVWMGAFGVQQGIAKSVEGLAGGYRSWGKAVEDTLGPLDRLLNVVLPGVWPLIKLTAEALGRLNEWDQNRVRVEALSNAHRNFQADLSSATQKINENRKAMASMEPTSQEYGKLAAQNAKLSADQVRAIESRVLGLKKEKEELEKNKEANRGAIQTIDAQIAALEGQLPVLRQNTAALADERREYETLTGNMHDFAAALADAADAREKAKAKIDLALYNTELDLIEKVKNGKIDQATAEAKLAQASLQAIDERVQGMNDELEVARQAYEEGGITQDKYREVYGRVTADLKDLALERAKAEQDVTDKINAAVEARLNKYQEEVNRIADNIRSVNSMLSNLSGIGSAGVNAFKSLGEAITRGLTDGYKRAYDEQGKQIDRAQQRELASIERQKDARLRMIESSGMADNQKSLAKEQLEQQFQNSKAATEKKFRDQKEAAEAAYEAKRKAALTEQFALEAKMLDVTRKTKEAELELWREEQLISAKLNQNALEIEQIKARARGASTEELALYDQALRINQESFGIIDKQYGLKKQVLGIESDVQAQSLKNKANAEGVSVAVGQQVTTMGQLESKLDTFISQWDDARESAGRIKEGLQDIPTEAGRVASEARAQFEQEALNTDFTAIAKNLKDQGFPPELVDEFVTDMKSKFDQGSREAGNIAADNIYEYFGDAIPTDLIKNDLLTAFTEGFGLSREEADRRLADLGEAIPKEQVAAILGKSLGLGVEEGREYLRSMKVPEGLLSSLEEGVKGGLSRGGDAGAQAINESLTGASTRISEDLAEAGQQGGSRMGGAIAEALEIAKKAVSDLGSGIKPEQFRSAIVTGLLGPIAGAQEALAKLTLSGSLAQEISSFGKDVKEAAGAGLSREMRDSKSATSALPGYMSRTASATRAAASSASSYARSMERAARAAQTAARARWSGGPVTAGQKYTVNELGKEMFMTSTGSLREIKAPAFGTWTAPTSGTIIPAGIAQLIRDSREAQEVNVAMQHTKASVGPRLSKRSEGGGSQAIIKELRNLGGSMGASSTVNNVTITSDRPVNDASKMLLDMAKLRARRHR